MGLIKKVLMGAATGAGLSKWAADKDWRKKNPLEARDWAGDPFFHPRLHDEQGLKGLVDDANQWDAMGRNYAHDRMATGAVAGAIAGAALHAGRRRRIPARAPPPPPPPRVGVVPHPHIGGVGVRVAGAAAAA